MIIYGATSGSYSDYRVNCLFEDEAACDEFIRNGIGEDKEEFEYISASEKVTYWTRYSIDANEHAGPRMTRRTVSSVGEEFQKRPESHHHFYKGIIGDYPRWRLTVTGDDEAHVRKVFSEQWAGLRLEAEQLHGIQIPPLPSIMEVP